MHRALAEAARGRGRVEPNPMVGAAVVQDGRLVGYGHHANFGGPHAEVVALERVGPVKGATLYVTLEPCRHHGKTPPCTELIISSGVARVVAAMRDPFPQVAGGGFARLREAGVAVDCGIGEREARRLNGPYLKRLATGRPYVIAKWAMTLDGKTATAGGDSRWITRPRSRSLVHERRGEMDAIVIGVGTALADDPELTARPEGPRRAVRVILDSAARLPPDGKLARTARETPVCVVVTDRAKKERLELLRAVGCEILEFPNSDQVPIAQLLDALGRRQFTNVLVEGGGRVLGSFWDASEVDEVDVFVAPIIEGGGHAASPVRGAGVDLMARALRVERPEVSQIDGDVRVQGIVPRPWREAAETSGSG
jgi:diaminohydroxyphosphoribosylaminopyrimidine deaminase / 5-amino-6-(5-phosphoribosylamino)uracil reductase